MCLRDRQKPKDLAKHTPALFYPGSSTLTHKLEYNSLCIWSLFRRVHAKCFIRHREKELTYLLSVHFHNVWFLKLGFELSITLTVTLGYSRGVKWQSKGSWESTSACLQPHTSCVSLKLGFHQIFSLIFFCFMMSSEIFPIFMENFF